MRVGLRLGGDAAEGPPSVPPGRTVRVISWGTKLTSRQKGIYVDKIIGPNLQTCFLRDVTVEGQGISNEAGHSSLHRARESEDSR